MRAQLNAEYARVESLLAARREGKTQHARLKTVAMLQEAQGKFAQAEQTLSSRQTSMPKDSGDAVDILITRLEKGDYSGARQQAQRVRSLGDAAVGDALNRVRAGLIKPLVYRGDFKQAEKVLEVMLALDSADPYIYRAMGTVQWHLGNESEAVMNYRRALMRSPDNNPLEKILERHSR
jgi:Flp pilus assembly protein TadD